MYDPDNTKNIATINDTNALTIDFLFTTCRKLLRSSFIPRSPKNICKKEFTRSIALTLVFFDYPLLFGWIVN